MNFVIVVLAIVRFSGTVRMPTSPSPFSHVSMVFESAATVVVGHTADLSGDTVAGDVPARGAVDRDRGEWS
ncbi:hypothetical protein [Mycobacterium vicinigordonae]|uniref:Uncharacterized protein n=1 Tax=Mycobacterium vicinigordonae TaxID=1719132 RepID=A0A7D6I2M5_9MYCO|nr:hypothetical protein [Mycobacterium vicinigordonae]QLL05498.1 hypothetical protein H0P51_16720 [Mycobacterium vicinigordonae]